MKNAFVAVLLGALLGVAALLAAFHLHPALALEMDRELPPRVTSGLYDPERSGQETFAWTSEQARFRFPNLNRSSAWRCTARVRSARPPEAPPASVSLEELATGGSLPRSFHRVGDDYQDISLDVPPKTPGVTLILTVEPAFTPEGATRPLGVRLDRLACAPQGWVWPSSPALLEAAVVPALFAVVFVVIGLGFRARVLATLAAAAANAWPLSIGLAPYTVYADRLLWLGVWIAAIAAGGTWLVLQLRREPLSGGARAAIALSGVAILAKLAALMHPSKAIVDAVFHAHRLDYVIGGHYFFTQQMPGGIQFPYAIALYVAASPWASMTRDHVLLLRLVVSCAEAGAGLFLYWAVARSSRDDAVGACAVLVYHVLPVSY